MRIIALPINVQCVTGKAIRTPRKKISKHTPYGRTLFVNVIDAVNDVYETVHATRKNKTRRHISMPALGFRPPYVAKAPKKFKSDVSLRVQMAWKQVYNDCIPSRQVIRQAARRANKMPFPVAQV